MLRFSRRGRLPIIQQTEAAECGLACLAMVASFYGHRVDLNTLRRRHPVSLKGVTLRGLIQTANHMQMACRPLRFEIEQLRQLRLPAILHWDLSHFVVLKSVTRKGITIHDPATGERSYTISAASKHISGVALELAPSEGFLQQDERARLPLSVFWTHLSGSGHALVQIFALSAVLQILMLAAPFYMQLTIDEVIARGDMDLLVVLALGFGLLMLVRVATNALRSWVLLVLQNVMHFHLGARLFRHLIRLPTSFFEQRHIGDVLSRFTSLQPIRALLTEGMITALIDGIMALLTLVDDLHLQPGARAGGDRRGIDLRDHQARALQRSVAPHAGNDSGRGSGELDIHRNDPRDPVPEAVQSRKRARGAMAQPVRRGCEHEREPWPCKDHVQHHQ